MNMENTTKSTCCGISNDTLVSYGLVVLRLAAGIFYADSRLAKVIKFRYVQCRFFPIRLVWVQVCRWV